MNILLALSFLDVFFWSGSIIIEETSKTCEVVKCIQLYVINMHPSVCAGLMSAANYIDSFSTHTSSMAIIALATFVNRTVLPALESYRTYLMFTVSPLI